MCAGAQLLYAQTFVAVHFAALDANGRIKTFWKYNFIVHMVDAHLSEKNELHMLPLELMVTTHISKQEEQQMGIPLSHTDD
jgi:hypothetical protein